MGQYRNKIGSHYSGGSKFANLRDQTPDGKEVKEFKNLEKYYNCQSCGKQSNAGINAHVNKQFHAQFCSDQCKMYYLP